MANVPAWKRFETRIAKAIGGRRIPVTGIDRHGADVVNPMFHVQAKRRKGMPGYVREWLDGICAEAKPHDKVGVVIWTEPGMRDAEAVVMLKYRDWVSLHGVLSVEEVEQR